MPVPNVNDLNDAARLCMQKMQRYMLAKLAKDEQRAALEFTNLDLAWSEYHTLQDQAPLEVIEVHRYELPNLAGGPVAA